MNNSRDYIVGDSNKKRNLDYYRRKIEKLVNIKLIYRYEMPTYFHNVKIINDIIYNEKTHFVEIFKEFLIYDDFNEFFKRYYKKNEILIKLPKILNFYEKYSKIYANYTAIPECKFMYKNIKRKQKVIDQMQNNFNDYEEEEYEECEELGSTIFNSKEIKYIDSFSMSVYSNNSILNTSKSDIGAKDLIKRINYYEKEAIYFKNNNIIKKNNLMINIHNNNKINSMIEKNKNKNLLSEKSFGISALINPNVKLKLLERKKKLNLINSINNNKSKSGISINDISKSDKIILSTNNSNSPNFQNKKIISSPSEGNNIINKKNIFSNGNFSFNQKNKSIKKISKGNIQSESQINGKKSKIFSKAKIDNLKINNNNTMTINKKSKSISKGKNKEKFIYNYNIVNNIHQGSTQINIYTGNDFINTHLHSKNIFHNISKPIYFNNNFLTNDNSINNSNTNNKDIKKKISKLNLRKIIYKNSFGKEALSDRKSINKNVFEHIGKKNRFHKNNISDLKSNSLINNNFSLNKTSKIINKNPSILNIKNLKNKSKNKDNNNNLNSIYFKRINSNINIGNKFKLKKLGSLINKNSETNIILSDKHKKKILFK